jgi:DNA-binding NarL/FixJ family response regulator
MVKPRSTISRILAVDDEDIILDNYQKILMPDQDEEFFLETDTKTSELYSVQPDHQQKDNFELVTCRQGDEAIEQVKKALEAGKPFSVAFVDVRMPPGPDGVWVARKIHDLDPWMNIVIVTAYSDIPPQVIAQSFKTPARLFYMQKPFHWDEIYQFASALSENWKIQLELKAQYEVLENQLVKQTLVLHQAQRKVQEALTNKRIIDDELTLKTRHVEDMNTALQVLLRERENYKIMLEENVTLNINQYILPNFAKLEKTDLTMSQKTILSTIRESLNHITSSFTSKIAVKCFNLTPVELEVANFIKYGSSTKEIADLLNLSTLTIESYRKSIRKKIGLTNKKENLRTRLMDLM